MDLSIFVAQVTAVIYLAVGVGMFFNKKYYAKLLEGFAKDMSSLYLGGFVALVVGFALVTFHNDWVKSWEVLVTIIGWLALIKGVMLLAFPATVARTIKTWFKPKHLSAYSAVIIVLGVVFGYFGFLT